jgi:hypothetical protein
MIADRSFLIQLGTLGGRLNEKIVCSPRRRLSCGGGPLCEYDPALREECRDCLRNFLYMVFDDEAKKVVAAEFEFAKIRNDKNPWSDFSQAKTLVIYMLEAKGELYHAAVKVLGHAQLHGVLDPIVDRESLGNFLTPLLQEDVLVSWHGYDKFALNVKLAKDRNLYSTKSLNSDMF